VGKRGGTTRLPNKGRIEWELEWEAKAGDAQQAVESLAADIAQRCGPGYVAEEARIIKGPKGPRAMAGVVVLGEAIRNEARNHTLANIA
jgi:hypothetical protein